MNNPKPLQIEIWSDVVCPWCYIGKRRFESALEQFAHHDHVEITWRSFELDPTAPHDFKGSAYESLAQKKGITVEESRAMHAQVVAHAAREGLEYNFDIAKPANTFDAHRLIHLAAAHGKQADAEERLFRAYFTEGRSIGDHETLVALGAELGLPADEVREMLAGDAYADAVRYDQRHAATLGIRGVPFFVIDNKYGISGAQPADLIRDALQQAWDEAHPLTLVGSAPGADGMCDEDGCVIEPAADERAAQ